jgi:hypothetical protein
MSVMADIYMASTVINTAAPISTMAVRAALENRKFSMSELLRGSIRTMVQAE